jgi:hypothetical protein
MATRAQKQTVWALWLQNFAETLEPQLVEIKQQGQSKLWHSESLARGKLLHAMLHWENRRAAMLPDTGSKPTWEMVSRPNRWAPSIMQYTPVTPRINQHRPLGRMTSPPHTHKKKEPKTNTQQRDRIAESTLEKGEEARSWSCINFQ